MLRRPVQPTSPAQASLTRPGRHIRLLSRGQLGSAALLVVCFISAGCRDTARSGEEPLADSATLTCESAVATGDMPSTDSEVIANVIALVTPRSSPEALPVARTGQFTEAPWWSKAGLWVRSGVAVEIAASTENASGVWLFWGNNPPAPAELLRIPACGQREAWLNFAGGFFFKEPDCISLVVRVAGTEHCVPVELGRDCPTP